MKRKTEIAERVYESIISNFQKSNDETENKRWLFFTRVETVEFISDIISNVTMNSIDVNNVDFDRLIRYIFDKFNLDSEEIQQQFEKKEINISKIQKELKLTDTWWVVMGKIYFNRLLSKWKFIYLNSVVEKERLIAIFPTEGEAKKFMNNINDEAIKNTPQNYRSTIINEKDVKAYVKRLDFK